MTDICPQGRTDHKACFAPFRYCPVKGCGRTERATVPKAGTDLIAAERQRQIQAEGWTPERDARYVNGELRNAAIAYAMVCDEAGEHASDVWPPTWSTAMWKPSEDPIRNLIRAGALIAAEIDRLQARV